eukprot:jgi/Chrzof1/12846/Cz07g09140.t1
MSAPMETDHANDGNDANPHVNAVNPLVNDGNPPLNERQDDGDGGNHALTNLQILCDELALTVTEQKEELAAQKRQFQGDIAHLQHQIALGKRAPKLPDYVARPRPFHGDRAVDKCSATEWFDELQTYFRGVDILDDPRNLNGGLPWANLASTFLKGAAHKRYLAVTRGATAEERSDFAKIRAAIIDHSDPRNPRVVAMTRLLALRQGRKTVEAVTTEFDSLADAHGLQAPGDLEGLTDRELRRMYRDLFKDDNPLLYSALDYDPSTSKEFATYAKMREFAVGLTSVDQRFHGLRISDDPKATRGNGHGGAKSKAPPTDPTRPLVGVPRNVGPLTVVGLIVVTQDPAGVPSRVPSKAPLSAALLVMSS